MCQDCDVNSQRANTWSCRCHGNAAWSSLMGCLKGSAMCLGEMRGKFWVDICGQHPISQLFGPQHEFSAHVKPLVCCSGELLGILGVLTYIPVQAFLLTKVPFRQETISVMQVQLLSL